MSYLFIISFFSFFSWMYLILFHGRSSLLFDNFFWSNKIVFENLLQFYSKSKSYEKICVIIPARNEQKTIFKTLNSLRNQNYKNLEIIVVNDNSTDNTKKIVIEFKKKFKKLTLIHGKELPTGWVGKTWALKQGVDLAVRKKTDYLLFLDSDITLKKDLLNKTIFFMKSKNLSMMSLMAKLNCKSIFEKILIPAFIFFFQKLYPFNLVNHKTSKIAAAAGGFIICNSQIFRECNLYQKIRDKIIDDCNIAKLVKSNGAIWLGLTNLVESKRSYQNLSSIWKMVSRTAFEQLNYSLIILFISILFLSILYLYPFCMVIVGLIGNQSHLSDIYLLSMNLSCVVIMTVILMPTLKFYELSKIIALTFPVSAFLYMCMTITSAVNYFIFSGNVWKGRKY